MEDQKLSIIQIVFGTAFIILLCMCFIITILYHFQKKQFLFNDEINNLKLDYENNLLKSELEIQEQTFQYISREIHDNIASNLTLSKLNLNSLNYPGPVSNEEKISSSIRLIGDVIEKLRNISKSLNSDLIKENGLFHALENEVLIIRNTNLYQVYYTFSGGPCHIDPDEALIIFRIIQEGFNNIIKHSKASMIKLELGFNHEVLKISIEDNGIGFILNEKNVGSGLKNIRQRTKMLEGEFEIISSVGNGTTLKISIPIVNS